MFFGYFLNTKKVTPSADFVIGPAKAEAFLFSHTRLPFPPRPLLPFGRISPAAKPGWPVIGPTGADVLPFPSRLRRAGAPTAKPRPCLHSVCVRPLFSAHFSAQKCPRRAMLSHSSRRGRPFALFHRAGAAFGTLTAAAAPPPSWSRRPLHIPCPPF